MIRTGTQANPDGNTITAPVSHFSVFTAMVHTAPASFELSGLTVTPVKVQTGESIAISATVTNTGDLSGSYTVTLEIGGIAVEEKK